MTAALVIVEGPNAGERLELDGEIVLGREGDVGQDDPELSRRHARLAPHGDDVEVEDLGSLNGTFVNGERISAATVVAGGDRVSAGQTVLEVERSPTRSAATVASPRPAAPAPPRAAAPAQPFGAHAAAAPKTGRGIASRRLAPTAISFAVIVATAIALVAYFAQH